MKLKDALARYEDRSGLASEHGRKLAVAGIAIVWIFSGGSPSNVNQVQIEHDLRWPAILFTLALTLDLAQYVWAAFIWGAFHRKKEKSSTERSKTRRRRMSKGSSSPSRLRSGSTIRRSSSFG